MPLVKQADGSFELTVPLPTTEPVLYKYVVDGDWLVNQSQAIARDGNGIENNSWDPSEYVTATSAESKIPEAGGLPVAVAAVKAAVESASPDVKESASSDLKTTVMPSTEAQQTTLGEPGIYVPKDVEALAAFETVGDVDPKTLNEPEEIAPVLTPEEKKKQKKKLKRTQYKARKKQQKSSASASSDSTPEPETLDPTVVGVIGAGAVAAEEPVIAEASETVVETAPVAAGSEITPLAAETVATEEVAEDVVAPVVKDVEPPVEPTIEPAIKEAVENGNLVASAAAVETEAAPAISEPVEVVPVTEFVEAETTEVKEVDAAPATKSKPTYDSDDEIIIAQGGLSKDVEAQLRPGDIVEEIQPTESEAKKLAEAAKMNEPKPAAKAGSKAAKKEEKKKKGFMSKLKKLFK